MAVTRLKRKDRLNKTVSRLETQRKKMGTNIEIQNRSEESVNSLVSKNRIAIDAAKKAAGI
jgi:hypothetical protein